MFTNITENIKSVVYEYNIKNGLCLIKSQHTTGNVRIIEDEYLLRTDYDRFLNRMVPEKDYYSHNEIQNRNVPRSERLNGHSHLRSLFFNTSEVIPVVNGELDLGKWQSIVFIETDTISLQRQYNIILLENL